MLRFMMDGDAESQQPSSPEELPLEIPRGQLSEEALAGIIENFVLREGTDYGAVEVSYEKKAEQIRRQIERGDIKIVYDPSSESVTLMTERDFRRYEGKF